MPIEVCAHVWVKYMNRYTPKTWTMKFCLLRVIDSSTLKFEILKEIKEIDTNDVEETLALIQLNKESCIEHRYMNNSINHLLKVKSAHIKELFPETKNMPYKIACDYLRDML